MAFYFKFIQKLTKRSWQLSHSFLSTVWNNTDSKKKLFIVDVFVDAATLKRKAFFMRGIDMIKKNTLYFRLMKSSYFNDYNSLDEFQEDYLRGHGIMILDVDDLLVVDDCQ